MRILLVRPRCAPETIGLQHIMLVEPLELEVLGALVAPEDTVEIADMLLERRPLEGILRESAPDVVCVTGYITHVPGMKACCRLAKSVRPAVRTVAGGVHVETCPDDADDPAIDFRVVRNATRAFPRLLEHLRRGDPPPQGVLRPGEVVSREALPPLDFHYPRPRRELTRRYRKHYFYVFHRGVALLKTSFGCPHRCRFCFCRRITDDQYFARPLDDVIDELRGIEEREVYVVDDDFLLSPARVAGFVRGLRDAGIDKHFLVFGRADFIAEHPALIEEFRGAGLRTVIVGLESFEDAELAAYRKRTSRGVNEAALRVLEACGVECYAAMITSPHWSEEDFRRTGDILLDLGVKFVTLQPLTPLKGTELEVDDADLALERDDYARWDLAHVAIRPTGMSAARYYENLLALYDRVVFAPRHLLQHARRYPLTSQWKLAWGLYRVRRQYLARIAEAHAQDPVHPTDPVP